MPWPVKDLQTLRLKFVQLALLPAANVRQLCRRFQISPTAGYKWLARFAAGGAEALADRSRRPRHSPDRTAAEVEAEVEAAVVALRREHPAWGARKLRRRLHDLGHAGLPAPSTLTGILHRHGLITPEATAGRHAPCAL
jgi:transposase-like protein